MVTWPSSHLTVCGLSSISVNILKHSCPAQEVSLVFPAHERWVYIITLSLRSHDWLFQSWSVEVCFHWSVHMGKVRYIHLIYQCCVRHGLGDICHEDACCVCLWSVWGTMTCLFIECSVVWTVWWMMFWYAHRKSLSVVIVCLDLTVCLQWCVLCLLLWDLRGHNSKF